MKAADAALNTLPAPRVQVSTLALDRPSQNAIEHLPRTHLPAHCQQRLENMKSDRARVQTRAGLWLLEQLLVKSNEPGECISAISFDTNDRPILPGGPSFNVSHSRDLVVCALSYGCEVGIDVETRAQRIPPRLSGIGNADERAAIDAIPGVFFDFWCAREATIKASGRVGPGRLRRVRLGTGFANVDGEIWHLRSIAPATGYAGCLATSVPIANRGVTMCSVSPLD